MLAGNFGKELAVNVLGGLLAGGGVLAVGYWLIDKRLRFQDRLDARQQRELDEAQRRNQAQNDAAQRRTVALEALYDEVRTNAGGLQANDTALAAGRIVYPLFSRTEKNQAVWKTVRGRQAFGGSPLRSTKPERRYARFSTS